MNSKARTIPAGNLLRRVATSAAMIGLIFLGVCHWPKWIFAAGVGVFAAWGNWELFALMASRGILTDRAVGVAASALMPLWVYWSHDSGVSGSGEVVFLVAACFALFVRQFIDPHKAPSLETVAMSLFGVLYCGWFLAHLVKIILLPQGEYWILYILAVTKSSDIAAYAVGSVWGKTKILPHLSPNKSLQGTIAGLIVSSVVSVAFTATWPLLNSGQIFLAAMGCAVGFLAQCGDLSESLIKRYCGAKDSGKSLPGFGGVLDLMDSTLFTAPFFYYWMTFGGRI